MTGARMPHALEAGCDLRTQLTRRVIDRCLESLETAELARRERLAANDWRVHATRVREHLRRAHGPMPFAKSGGPLEARLVSRHDTRHCRVENVLFDSFPGWQVNASLFIPKGKGPFPAVVIPVGHSGKQFDNYQIPAQAFASLGFLAVLFDPPGQASERQIGNDHFHDGVRCHLTGLSSNRYFVLDALRCIDYLASRPDADLSRGVGMTGVSGGGHTTACASLFDDRIACQGPSCCFTKLADHPVGDGYSPCPEGLWWNRIGEGVDEVDIMLAAAPLPTLYMAGVDDEVFHIDWSRELAAVTAAGFAGAGAAERFAFFEDQSGHAYTLRQVEWFTAWMNRWLLGLPADRCAAPRLDRGDFQMLDYEMLKCRPSQAVTMFSINAAAARDLGASRPGSPSPAAARAAVGRLVGVAAPGLSLAARWEEGGPIQLWAQDYREAICRADGLAMPVSLLSPAAPLRAARWVLFLDEAGRGCALEANGPATRLCAILDREAAVPHPAMAVADLPGWGDSAPAIVPFALTSWGSRDRLLAYLSVALGDGVLAMQVRAASALIDAVGSRAEQAGDDGADIAVVGRGLGGAVALLAAACSERATAVVSWSSLAAFELLASSERYAWPAAAFLPNALREIDLPEVAAALAAAGKTVLILDPLDAERRSLGRADAARLYRGAEGRAIVMAGPTVEQASGAIREHLFGSRKPAR